VCDVSVLQCACVCVLLHSFGRPLGSVVSPSYVVCSRLAPAERVYSFFLALSLAVTVVVVAAAEVEADEGWTLGARVANLTME